MGGSPLELLKHLMFLHNTEGDAVELGLLRIALDMKTTSTCYVTNHPQYDDIRILTEKSPQERSAFVRQHARSISGTSQRAPSISSDGNMDEEDEEPFSASNPAVINTGPKQDELPKRPAPGGRFPSDISLVRGLQAPLSPSSGSSNFEDRDVVAAAGTLPGSNVYQFGQAASSPTAYVHQMAQEDGINPYTSQRMSQERARNLGGVAAAGVGGVAAGAVGAGVYQKHEDEKADQLRKEQAELAELAALEASTVAAPDTYEHESEALAAREAAIYAAPDSGLAGLTSVVTDIPLMSGGRSEGDVGSGKVFAGNALPEATPAKSGQSNPIEVALRPVTDDPLLRPTLAAGQHHQSVQSVSQLHVPGEFPKENAKLPTSMV